MQSLIIFFFVVGVCSSAHLPSTFQKCSRNKSDFRQCLVKAADNCVSQLNHAIPSAGLINLEPLEIPFMFIPPGSGPTRFDQNYTDLKISGLTKTKFSTLDVDFDNKIIATHFTIPELVLNFTYDVGGKILVFPLSGHGPGLIILDQMVCNYTCHFEEYVKNGEKYFKITRSELLMQPNSVHYKLDNLFNGDEQLGTQINKVLNDNWSDLYADVKSGYEEAYNKIFNSLFSIFFNRVPVSELFG
ncbi:hypothetical protein Zmor_017286 [Zophobas morio]|uniref:Uncharacterized protein n=1 Tax=Zophobas morio TaxID=2755281 RepID=A0AA38I8R8_9CUCU|nr:hypothetical protein Zmor_017286 [Zophobas morio]